MTLIPHATDGKIHGFSDSCGLRFYSPGYAHIAALTLVGLHGQIYAHDILIIALIRFFDSNDSVCGNVTASE